MHFKIMDFNIPTKTTKKPNNQKALGCEYKSNFQLLKF